MVAVPAADNSARGGSFISGSFESTGVDFRGAWSEVGRDQRQLSFHVLLKCAACAAGWDGSFEAIDGAWGPHSPHARGLERAEGVEQFERIVFGRLMDV